jgi:predicted CXXCH cytochrome family protein
MAVIILLIFLGVTVQFSTADVDHSIYQTRAECIECHPRDLPTHTFSHPLFMSEDLPLDYGGNITCFTCHDCASGRCMFRKKREELCMVCHDCSQGMACSIGAAHLGSARDINILLNGCLACHDGFIGPSVGTEGHRVNMVYTLKKGFNSISDSRIVFVDGKVTCISCHNPYKNEDKRLIKSNEGSRLCLTCHSK